MQEFVRTETGLEEAARSKIRNYQNLNCVKEAIANGELKEHDLFTTVCSVEATGDDLASIIYWLCALTPDNASPENQFATQGDLNGVAGDSVTCADFNTYQSDMQDTLDTMQSDIDDAIACKVDCTDYTSKMGDLDTDITNLSNNKVNCSDYSTAISNINITKVTCSDYNSYTSCANTRLNTLEAKPGLNCTGTLVPSDIAGKTDCSYSTGLASRIAILEAKPGLNCTGTITSSNFSLVGNTLTITF